MLRPKVATGRPRSCPTHADLGRNRCASSDPLYFLRAPPPAGGHSAGVADAATRPHSPAQHSPQHPIEGSGVVARPFDIGKGPWQRTCTASTTPSKHFALAMDRPSRTDGVTEVAFEQPKLHPPTVIDKSLVIGPEGEMLIFMQPRVNSLFSIGCIDF